MKANELMIGDWVKLLNAKGEWLDNTKISSNLLYASEQYEKESQVNFDPIPLTEDIMEKNHFNRTSCMFGSRGFTYLGKEVSWDGDNLIIQDLTCRTLLFVKVDYVHQVQHAIRMFDMSNLADEFVV